MFERMQVKAEFGQVLLWNPGKREVWANFIQDPTQKAEFGQRIFRIPGKTRFRVNFIKGFR